MEALSNTVVPGFVISLICMAYLIFRSCYVSEKTANNTRQRRRQNESSANWLGIILFGTGVFYVWCSIGIGMHFLLKFDPLVVRLSLFALATGMLMYYENMLKTIGKTETLAVCLVLVFVVYSHVASLVF